MKKLLLILAIPLLMGAGCSSGDNEHKFSVTSDSINKSNAKCNSNYYNCEDFSTHAEAQRVYESCGGVSNDIHRLDRDKDGLACETLP